MTEKKFTKILDTYGNYFATRGHDPETWGLMCFFIVNHKATGFLRLSVQFCNPDGTCRDTKVLDEFLAPFQDLSPGVNSRSWQSVNRAAEHSAPHGMLHTPWAETGAAGGAMLGSTRAKYKSACMRNNFTAHERRSILQAPYAHDARGGPDTFHGAEVDSYGGAMSRKEMLEETVWLTSGRV